MNIKFNINTDASVIFANKLEKLHRSGLPLAIRGTLNDAAFEVKKNAMPKYTKETFEERRRNFFKANSKVEGAQGFDINRMQSTVGFLSSGLHSPSTNYAVRDLKEQEEGGNIGGRSFKPLPDARIGKTMSGNVRPNNRISQILKSGNVVDVKDSKGADWSQRSIRASLHAGKGGYVLGGKILWRVSSITRVGRNIRFEKEKLYSFTKSGTAKVHATGFMKKASLEVQKEMEMFFRIQANKQIQRLKLK